MICVGEIAVNPPCSKGVWSEIAVSKMRKARSGTLGAADHSTPDTGRSERQVIWRCYAILFAAVSRQL